MFSNTVCGEVATPEALPVQAAETEHCWKAPCWALPGASVIRNKGKRKIGALNFQAVCV